MKRGPTEVNRPEDTTTSVTVLIATRGRPESLIHSLRSVLECEYPAFEVLVIDQSPPEQRGWIPTDPRLRRIASSTIGKSRALNEGLAMLTSEFVAFTDDDCTVPPGWLQRAVDVLAQEPDAAIVAGASVAPSSGTSPAS